MHRWAVLAVLVAAWAAPVASEAQGRSMGARVAPSAPRYAPPRAAAPAGRARVMPAAVRPVSGSHLRPGVIAGNVQRRTHRHHVIFTSPCFAPNWVNPLCRPFFGYTGYSYFGYPYMPYPYGYPSMYGTDYSYPSQPARQVQQQPAYVEDNSGLRDEVSRLADEVERMRQEQAQPRTPPPPTREAAVPTTLVYRDGRRIEVQNYAVVGQTLWIFSETHARKVPLADLDVPSTRAANEQRGVEFLGPK